MKHTTLNLKERERERERENPTHTQRTSRITIITGVSKITGLMFCITTLKPTPTAQKTPCNTHIHSGGHGMSYVY
jgi:hypothetical protein